jgi:hypothetical protein
MNDCAPVGIGRTLSGPEQNTDCFAIAATSRLCQMLPAQRFAGRPCGVELVALGTVSPGWPDGPIDLDDGLAMFKQKGRQAAAKAASSFDSPEAPCRSVQSGKGKKSFVAKGIGCQSRGGSLCTLQIHYGGRVRCFVCINADHEIGTF